MRKTMVMTVVLGAAWLAGCSSRGAAPAQAGAALEPRSGSTVTGMATFTELPEGGVKVVVHIEKDCSAPDATSAGGHFNPTTMPHAGPMDAQHHAGDLGNIEIKADGTGDLTITSKMLTVKPGPNSVLGRAVIFHEKADDLKTQPTGNAGGRLACGVVR